MKQPFFHAIAALGYIVLVVLVMTYGEGAIGSNNRVLAPIAMLSLFVLSVTVMGLLFLGKPLTLYLDGQKKEAVQFFFSTVGIFAGLTIFVLAAVFLGA